MPDFQISAADQRQAKRKRRLLWAGGGFLALGAVLSLVFLLPSGPSVAKSSLVIATTNAGTFAVSVQAPGTLQSRQTRFVTAPVPGTVAAVLVQPGDTVKPGTVLVRLVNPSLQSAVLAARSSLADANATMAATAADLDNQLLALQSALSTAEAALASAALRAQAERGLEAEHIVAELDYRSTLADAANASQQVTFTRRRIIAFQRNAAAQLQSQQARVAALQAALDEAEQNEAALIVTAGTTGVVQNVTPQPGQTLALGEPIAQIASVTDLKAVLAVAPSDAGQVAIGQGAEIQLNNAESSSIPGIVSRVSPSVANGSVQVDVSLPANLPAGTRPDLAVLGQISITTVANTIFLTRPVGAAPDSSAQVYELKDGGSKAVLVPVRFGAASADAIQVLSGLEAGAQIIVSDTNSLNGQPSVRVQ